MILPFAVGALTLAVIGALLLTVARWDALRRRRAVRVIVNLKSGRAIHGLLVGTGRMLELAEPTVHEPGATPVQADGRVLVARTDVDFVQVP